MSKYLDVLKELAHFYLQPWQISQIEEECDGSYEYYVLKALMNARNNTHKEINRVFVEYNDFDLSDPDFYKFVFKFDDKLYAFDYFSNSNADLEVVEDSFKEVTAKEKVVTVYE